VDCAELKQNERRKERHQTHFEVWLKHNLKFLSVEKSRKETKSSMKRCLLAKIYTAETVNHSLRDDGRIYDSGG
jgi:predicted glycosyltransferase involved in capsule biosynthesis